MRRASCAAVLALLTIAGEAAAGPATPSPGEAAAAVAKAFAAQSADEVKRLAQQDDPDPWLVADALLLQGSREAAEAFAKAAPRKDVERLPEFVAKWSASEADASARGAIAKANVAFGEKRPADGLAALADVPAAAMPYLKARMAYGKAIALSGLGKHAEAAEQFNAAAADLEALGWLARAAQGLLSRAQAQAAGQRAPAAFETLKRLVALETARRSPSVGLAQAHRGTGLLHKDGGQWEEARAALTRALEMYRELKDDPRVAVVLNDLGVVQMGSGKPEEAIKSAEASLAISEPAGLSADIALSNAILGDAHHAEGRFDLAVGRYEIAVPNAQKAGDAGMEARVLFFAGRTLGELEEHGKAVERLRRAVRAYEALGRDRAEAATIARARLAWSLAGSGALDEARREADRAVAESKKSGKQYVEGAALWAMGTLLHKEGKADEALKTLSAAIEHLEAAPAGAEAILSLTEAAEIRRAQSDLPEARKAADLALERAKRLGDRLALAAAPAVAARVRKDQGESKDALDLARQALLAYQGIHHTAGADAMSALVRELETAGPR